MWVITMILTVIYELYLFSNWSLVFPGVLYPLKGMRKQNGRLSNLFVLFYCVSERMMTLLQPTHEIRLFEIVDYKFPTNRPPPLATTSIRTQMSILFFVFRTLNIQFHTSTSRFLVITQKINFTL